MFPFDCRILKFKKYNKSLFLMLKIHFYIHFRINLSFFGRAPPKHSFFGSGFPGFRFRSIATQQLRCPYNTLLRTVCMSGNYFTLRLWRRCIPHASKLGLLSSSDLIRGSIRLVKAHCVRGLDSAVFQVE